MFWNYRLMTYVSKTSFLGTKVDYGSSTSMLAQTLSLIVALTLVTSSLGVIWTVEGTWELKLVYLNRSCPNSKCLPIYVLLG